MRLLLPEEGVDAGHIRVQMAAFQWLFARPASGPATLSFTRSSLRAPMCQSKPALLIPTMAMQACHQIFALCM